MRLEFFSFYYIGFISLLERVIRKVFGKEEREKNQKKKKKKGFIRHRSFGCSACRTL